MIRHIIMFKLKESSNTPEGRKMAESVKKELEKLKEEIHVIRHLEVGINIVPLPHAYDLVLTTDFDSLEHLQEYKVHRAHVAFIEFNKNYSVSKVSVDYLY
jgi:hypothetical protein